MGVIVLVKNSGYVTGVENVGGVCGYHSDANSDTYIFYGMNDGTVTGEDNVGGICGESMCDIKLCSNTGEVNGNNHVGGILGVCVGCIHFMILPP